MEWNAVLCFFLQVHPTTDPTRSKATFCPDATLKIEGVGQLPPNRGKMIKFICLLRSIRCTFLVISFGWQIAVYVQNVAQMPRISWVCIFNRWHFQSNSCLLAMQDLNWIWFAAADTISTQPSAVNDLLYLGAGEVIEEVIKLLARLELDRRSTFEQLEAEKYRAAELQNRIDRLSFARLIAFPSIVQRGILVNKRIYDLITRVTRKTKNTAFNFLL